MLSDNGNRNNGNFLILTSTILIRFVTELFKALVKLSDINLLTQDADSHISFKREIVKHMRYSVIQYTHQIAKITWQSMFYAIVNL